MANNPNVQRNLRKGGKPGNAGGGRTPDQFKALCRKLIDKYKIVEFMADVAAGRIMEKKYYDGRIVEVPASFDTRRDFANDLMDRGLGKPAQEIALSGFANEIDAMREKFK